MTKPEIVCLCGSTRFYATFQRINYEQTMQGRIVLSVGFYGHVVNTPEQKVALDDLHLRKIDLSDRIIVLNVDGYIGDSTRREIAYALATGKRVSFLDEVAGEQHLTDRAHEIGDFALSTMGNK